MKSVTALLAAFLLFSGCQARTTSIRPRLEDAGAVYVYLKPFSSEAERLSVHMEGISAVRRDGRSFPLSLHLKDWTGKELRRERLLASGELPPGEYDGFKFNVKSATLKGEEGEIALRTESETSLSPIPFQVVRIRAVLLTLRFGFKESVPDGARFSPSFSAVSPGKIPIGLIGLATNRVGNAVTMFDKNSGQVTGVVPTGVAPCGIALDPASRKAYVAIREEDAIEAVDLLEAVVIDRQRLSAGDNPQEIALTLDGKTLLTANSGSNSVSIVDSSSLVERKRLKVGAGPQSILIDRNGRRAYVFNTLANTISVIDIGAGAVAATIATESGPIRGQFNRLGSRLYVLHVNSPYLSVIDPLSLSVVRRINVGSGGSALKVDPRTDLVYLAKQYGDDIDVYDPFSLFPIDFLRAGGNASYLTIDGDANRLLIVLPGDGRIRIVNIVGKDTFAEIDIGDDPYQVAVMGEK